MLDLYFDNRQLSNVALYVDYTLQLTTDVAPHAAASFYRLETSIICTCIALCRCSTEILF